MTMLCTVAHIHPYSSPNEPEHYLRAQRALGALHCPNPPPSSTHPPLPISICILSDKTIEIETSSVAVIIDIHLYLNNKKHSVIIKMRIIICVATIIIISDIRGQQE